MHQVCKAAKVIAVIVARVIILNTRKKSAKSPAKTLLDQIAKKDLSSIQIMIKMKLYAI